MLTELVLQILLTIEKIFKLQSKMDGYNLIQLDRLDQKEHLL